MINNPPAVSDDCTPTPENSILADDWNMTENTASEETAPYDGKIIARMPDLGSNSFAGNIVGNIEGQKFPSVWKNVYQSMMSADNRQKFFKRMTALGGAVLLCGVGILFLEQSDNEPENNSPANNAQDVAKMLSEQSIVPDSEMVPLAKKESKQSSETQPDSSVFSVANTGNTIPVADITAVQRSVAQSSPNADSPWDRPAGNTYSPWNVASKQKENSPAPPAPPVPATPPTPVVVENSPAPPAAVPTAAVPPVQTVEMTPMTPLSMPVSPYEEQLFVAQAPPPARPPVDPFVQSNVQSGNTLVPGMVQTHERVNNPVNMVPQNNVAPSTPQPQYQQQYQQPAVPQGRQPMNALPQGYTNGPQGQPTQQGQHGQYGQYNQYTSAPVGVASNVSAANVPPQNMPIPSGVSTLQPQGGYYPQPSGNVPAQNNNFHPNVTPAYRRVY